MRNVNYVSSGWRQSGATLIVSLVILAVVTLLGVASMRASNLELRMAASARDRSIAFQAAEAALIKIEKDLIGAAGVPPLYGTPNFLPSCSSSTNACFSSACTNGLCFTGDFVGAQTFSDCQLAKGSGETDYPWQQNMNWQTDVKHDTVNVTSVADEDVTHPVKFMIEFLCYVPVDEKVDSPAAGVSAASWVPLFRITTRAEGESGRANVMLQSVVQAASL